MREQVPGRREQVSGRRERCRRCPGSGRFGGHMERVWEWQG